MRSRSGAPRRPPAEAGGPAAGSGLEQAGRTAAAGRSYSASPVLPCLDPPGRTPTKRSSRTSGRSPRPVDVPFPCVPRASANASERSPPTSGPVQSQIEGEVVAGAWGRTHNVFQVGPGRADVASACRAIPRPAMPSTSAPRRTPRPRRMFSLRSRRVPGLIRLDSPLSGTTNYQLEPPSTFVLPPPDLGFIIHQNRMLRLPGPGAAGLASARRPG